MHDTVAIEVSMVEQGIGAGFSEDVDCRCVAYREQR